MNDYILMAMNSRLYSGEELIKHAEEACLAITTVDNDGLEGATLAAEALSLASGNEESTAVDNAVNEYFKATGEDRENYERELRLSNFLLMVATR